MKLGTTLNKLPWWLLAAVFLAVLFGFHIFEDTDYRIIFGALKKCLITTVFVAVVAYSLAILLGLLIAGAGFSKYRVVREVARFYVEIFRGIPILVLLFYIAFVGAPQLVAFYNWVLSPLIENQWMSAARVRDFSLMWRAILALSVSYSAFIAESLGVISLANLSPNYLPSGNTNNFTTTK